ncbi:MAG: RNA-binding protein [Alsobacter sp.]
MSGTAASEDEGPQSGPHRLCVATRAVKPVEELIRFVVGPGDVLAPDLRHKLPGRGVWVTATREAVGEAVRRRAFGRSLKASVVVPPGLADEIEALLVRWARESLSLANKAGQVASGFAKVEAAIGSGAVEGVIQARDAAADGVRKIAQALRRRYGERERMIPVVDGLESSELGLALGRSHVIHAALMKGSASRACLARFRALERYRGGGPATQPVAGPAADMTTTTPSQDPRTTMGPAEDRTTAERQDSERND